MNKDLNQIPNQVSPQTLTEQQPENTQATEIGDIQKGVIENTTLIKFGHHEIPESWARELAQFITETTGKFKNEDLEKIIFFENNQYILRFEELNLVGRKNLTRLPSNLEVTGSLYLNTCTNLVSLPRVLSIGRQLDLRDCPNLTVYPEILSIGGHLWLNNFSAKTQLPKKLTVGKNLYGNNCANLTYLPEELTVKGDLELHDCHNLVSLPGSLSVKCNLDLRRCTRITGLPQGLSLEGEIHLEGCTSLIDLPVDLNIGTVNFDKIHSRLFTISQLSNLKEHLVNNLHWQITGDVNITIPTFIPHIESGLGKGDIEAQKELANIFQVQLDYITPKNIQETLSLLRWTEDLIKEGYEDILNLTADETDETKIARFIEYRTRKDQIIQRLRSVISKPLLEAVKEYTISTSEAPKIISFLKLDLTS